MKKGKDKLRAVYVGRFNDGDILSGPEKTANRIFRESSKGAKTVFIQYFFDERKYGLIKKLIGKQMQAFGENGAVYTIGLFRLIPLLLSIKPEIIHIITFERFAVLCLFYKLISKVKIVYSAHGIISYENERIKFQSFFYRFKDRFCEKRYLKNTDKIIFPSEKAKSICSQYCKINLSKTQIIPNGIDTEFHDTFAKRQTHSAGDLKAVAMNLTEYSASGMKSLNKLISSHKNTDFFIIGNNLSNESNQVHYINLMDVSKLAEFYKDKDIFLSLNNYDTFSVASAEAMAAGLIPIVTSNTGMAVYIEDGRNGFVVEYGNIKRIGDILEQLYSNSELTAGISKKASAIFEKLTWKNVYSLYLEMYKNLTA